MNIVLYFKSSDLSPYRKKLSGVMEYAMARKWNVQTIEPTDEPREIKRILRFWNPSGCIVDCGFGNNTFSSSTFGDIPVVFLDRESPSKHTRESFVYFNSAQASEIAARELLSLNIDNYAYVHWYRNLHWDRERWLSFDGLMNIHGKRVFEFRPSTRQENVRKTTAELASWISGVPKPLAILVASDTLAVRVIEACRLGGFKISEDVAIVGIDNDEDVCEYVQPTLSSVEPDFVNAGRMAADTLNRLMTGKTSGPIQLAYGPLRFVARRSSRRLHVIDADASAAVELIRKESCNGLTAAQAAACFSCSRRMAEIRFRKATGHSFLESIHSCRLQKAFELLSDPKMRIDAIANFCGYHSAIAFTIFFKGETGISPSAFRARKNPPCR